MTGRRFRIAVPILLGLALASNGQEPSLWHGRVIGIEDAPDGHRQNLTYTDLESVSLHGVLTSDSELSYLLDRASVIVYVLRRKFTGQDEGSSLEIIPLNHMAARIVVDFSSVCQSCSTCEGCGPGKPQITISTDGHYVFVALYRIRHARALPPPGQFANDDDASGVEEVVVTYDTAADRFLDPFVFPVSFGGWLLPSSQPDACELLMGDGSLVRYRVAGHGIRKDAVLNQLAFPDSHYQLIRDPTNPRTLFLFENGKVIEAAAALREMGDIAPLPTLRRMYSPSISGNGKLLFVPTGPNTWPAKKFSASAYIDQIDVYDAMTLVRLRSLHSQRPLLDVIPDQDGGRLFAAIPGRPSFLILNSNTLWQEEDHLTQFPIRKMTLLP